MKYVILLFLAIMSLLFLFRVYEFQIYGIEKSNGVTLGYLATLLAALAMVASVPLAYAWLS